jgi:ubiquinone/menaquinone biosynthesis C-methylase UbiE
MNEKKLNEIFEKYSILDDQNWRSDLVRSIAQSEVNGVAFPTFPSAELQRHLQGNSNEIAIRGALAFRQHCVGVLNRQPGSAFSHNSTLLDFGTGWGRIARAFMKDVPAANIYAVEPFDFILEARKNNHYISFVKSSPLPPLPFRDGFATHLVTWSTFSHFNKTYFDAWINEFARVLRSGGICFITTLGVRFLQDLKKCHLQRQTGESVHFWLRLVLDRLSIDEIDSVIDKIREGDFYWLPSDVVARSEFAECFVTDRYFHLNFPHLFEVIDYADNGELAQDVIALRRL